MSTSASTGAQQRISGYGVGAPSIRLNPPPIISPNAPTANNYRYPLGQTWVNTTSQAVYTLVSNAGNSATWVVTGGGSSDVSTINGLSPVAGNIVIAGTANQIAVSNSGNTVTLSIPSSPSFGGTVTAAMGFTATMGNITATTGNIVATAGNITATAGSISAGTTITATLGNITATNGNFVASTAGNGLVVPVATGSGAASGTVTCNGRQGSVSFTSPSIAAGATATLTMGNSSITGSSTLILYSISGATTGSALSIQSITNSAGQSAVVLTNGTGATTQTGTITLNFLILN